MPRLFGPVLLAGICTLASLPAHGQTNGPCAGEHAPRVEVVARLMQASVDNLTPREQLSMVASISRPGPTDGITEFQANYRVETTPSDKGASCPYRLVKAHLGAQKLNVYIAKEVSPKDCRFRAVYDHEMKHVMLAQRAMDRGADALKKALRAALAAFTPEQLANAEEVSQALNKVAANAVDLLYEEYAQGNELLDTQEEAVRLDTLCAAPRLFRGGVEQR